MEYKKNNEIKTLGFKLMKKVFLLSVIALFLFVIIQSAKAEDDDNERDDGNEHVRNWDFSDDFNERDDESDSNNIITKEQAPVYIYETDPVEQSPNALTEDLTVDKDNTTSASYSNERIELSSEDSDLTPEEKAVLNMTIPKLNLNDYEDSDNDGIINKNDRYPGENDKYYIDSDQDGIVDSLDKFPGKNDLDFEDSDNDGVIDSQDSNIGKKTDKDHDGIDDAYDPVDSRSFFAKFAAFFGID
jgi:hypothetical protein